MCLNYKFSDFSYFGCGEAEGGEEDFGGVDLLRGSSLGACALGDGEIGPEDYGEGDLRSQADRAVYVSDQDSLTSYHQDLAALPPLTEEQNSDLMDLMLHGKEKEQIQARSNWILHNQRLVEKLARKYAGSGVEITDLIQEMYPFLMEKLKTYDPAKAGIATFAYIEMRGRMIRYVQDNGRTIRIPNRVHEEVSKWKKIAQEENQRLGHEASDEEIEKEFTRRVLKKKLKREPEEAEIAAKRREKKYREKMARLREAIPVILSLETPVGDSEEESCLGDFQVAVNTPDPADHFEQDALGKDMAAALMTLSPRERFIVYERCVSRTGLREIGEQCGISVERVRQIFNSAMKKLRGTEYLRCYS